MNYLKTFSNWKESINEGFSEILYHVTTLEKAIQIFKSDRFNLAWAQDDMEAMSSDYLFRMSFARTTTSGYPQFVNPRFCSVVFKIDGWKLNQRYKSKKFNHWRDMHGYIHTMQNKEAEDRLISKDEFVPNASEYIIEAYIYIETPNEIVAPHILDLLKELRDNPDYKLDFYDLILYCKEKSIPLFLFSDKKSLTHINKKRAFELTSPEYLDELLNFLGDISA